MRILLALLALFSTAAYAQAANIDAKADFAWTRPTTYTDGSPIVAGALTKMQIWVKTAAIADTDTSAPTAELAGTATTYSYVATIPNGSTIYGRVKACTASVCSAFSAQVSKMAQVLIPSVPIGVSVTVTVTVSSTP